MQASEEIWRDEVGCGGEPTRRLEASKRTRRDGDEDGVERSLQGRLEASKQGEIER